MRALLPLVLLAFPPLWAQPPDAVKRPRIGVVLAGGSALGLSHIGVLRWLEENHIPIDAVGGASMGGLVGGMYATGADTREITAFLTSIDWAAALQPSAPFRQLAYRRKEDRREFPNQLEFGVKKGVRLPSALSAGHGVGLVLSRFAGPYAAMRSFDDLPTPFRAVATDLVTASQVEFSSGDLQEALRATMSLPGIFAPVRRDGKVMVDGGVINNLPVDVVKKMPVDIIIAVALHVPLRKRADEYSLFGVFDRSIDIMISGAELRAMANADVVVIPDLSAFSSGDFHRSGELIDRGYQAAVAKANLLRRFAASDAEWEAHLAARRSRRRTAAFRPQFVAVEGLTPPLENNLEQRLQPMLAAPDPARFEQELTRLTGLGRWDSASYSLIERDGRQGVLIKVHEKPHGPPFLNTNILIDGGTSQTLRFGIGGRLTFLDVGNPGSEWRTDFSAGFRDTLSTEYFHRIRSTKLFVAPRAFLEKSSRDLYDRDDRVARFSTREFGAAIDLGYAAGRFTEFRLGYQASQFKNAVSIGLPTLPSLKGNVSRMRARYVYEGQDSAIVATRGMRVQANAQWVFDAPGARDGFPILDGDLRWATPLSGPYILTGQFSGGTTVNRENLFAPFTLGGPLRLTALAPQQLFGSHFYFSEVGVLRALSRKPTQYFARMYLGAAYEMGAAFGAGASRRPFHDGVLGLIGETPIGVLFFGGAYGEQGQRKLFFRLGRYF